MNIYLIQTILIAVQLLFITRFHLELSNVNGYTEPVNTIRKITNPFVMPFKQFIPLAWAKKFAAILVAFILTFLIFVVVFGFNNLMTLFFSALFSLLKGWITFLQYGMFLFIIGSWLRVPVLQGINQLLYALFEPILRPFRQFIPSFGGIDFSPILFFMLLSFVSSTLSQLFGV